MSMLFKRIKDWATTITAFRTGDVIPVDGPDGTAKMSKDDLLTQVASNNKAQVYITNRGSFYCEETNTSLGSIYIKAVGGVYALRGTSIDRSYSNSDMAIALGVSLTTSPSGVADCIEIADAYCLVVGWDNNFALKTRTSVAQGDVVIVACIEGNVCAYNSQAFGYAVARRLRDNESTASALDDKNTRQRIQFYANGQNNIYVEESRTDLGKVWIKSSYNQWAGRLGVNWNYTNATLATALGKTLETSPKGVAGCIPIDDEDNIVITSSKTLACKKRNDILDSDVVVFACLDGKFRGFDSVIFGQLISDQLAEIRGLIGDASNPFYFADTGWMTKQEDFCELFNGVSLCDSFLFFTDPHFMGAVDWSNNTKNYVEIIRKWYDCTPTDFIVCGGDWLQNNDTQALALSKLGFIDGIMNHTFDKYYPILGNHDTNYQGVVSADDQSRGDLPQGTLNSIWFNRVGGKSYYDFKARATKFYVFDSGIDWTASVVSEYEWEQVDWFANKLLAGTDEHIGLMLHLISNNENEIQPVAFAQTLLDIAYAFNSRTSVTKNGVTYDFTAATGYVEFMLGGHSHSDLDTTFHDIPVVVTTRVLTPGTNPTFDLVMVDYTNNKLHMVRIGSGSDRSFDIYSASLS